MDASNNADPFGPPALPREADPHGEAALLLVESLLHALIAKSAMTVREAVDVVDVAVDASAEIALDGGSIATFTSGSLLAAISGTLRHDVGL